MIMKTVCACVFVCEMLLTQAVWGQGISPISGGSNVSATINAVGNAINLACNLATAGVSVTCTADQIVVGTALNGTGYSLPSYSQTFNGSGTGAGGLDTGAMPDNSWVCLYAIYNPTTPATSIVGAVTGTPGTCPTIYGNGHAPSGYTASALIAIWPTNGSGQLIVGYVAGRRITIPFQTVLSTNTSKASYTSQSLAASTGSAAVVPPSAVSVSGSTANTLGTGPSAGIYVFLVASDVNGTGVQGSAVSLPATTGAQINGLFTNLALPTAQTLWWQDTTSGTTPGFVINVTGYSW